MKQLYFLITFFVTNLIFSQNFTDTKGELQISNSGTATYNLPIALPPSIKNVAPNINLTYSSGVKGGIAGQGWNINSLSTISRMATRRDIDGFVDGVDFDDNDKLALDGQRLLLKTGSYWSNGSTYETEYKSNTKIELKIENGGTSTFFIVTSPDGSRTWYGSTGSGTYQNATSVNAWYIVRFEDVNGNFINYTYKTITYNSTNQLYIDTIVFSGNTTASVGAQNKIAFKYENAKRVERDYLKGTAIYATQILKSIEVYADVTNNTIFRTYKLTHTVDDSGYERVQTIKEVNAQNEESNPVVFEYNSTPQTTTRTEKAYTNNLNFNDVDLAGDFDGDGRLDFVADNKIFTNLFNGNTGNSPISLPFIVNKRRFVATTISNNKLNQFQSIVNSEESLNKVEFKTYNLTASGVVLANSKTIDFDNTIYHDYSLDNNQYETRDDDGLSNPGYNCSDLGIKDSNTYLEGDFDGNGISEVLLERTINERYYFNYLDIYYTQGYTDYACSTGFANDGLESYILNLDPNASTTLGSNGYVKLQNNSVLIGYKRIVADFNGDGKSDILVLNANKTYKIVSFKQLTVSPWIELEVIGSGTLDKYSITKQLLLGDYNGDGKADIMLPDAEGGDGQTLWHTYYSNPNPAGGEFFVKESQNIVEYWPNTGSHFNTQIHFSNYYAIDINKDGKSDIVRVWRKYYKPAWTINDHDTEWWVKGYTNNIGKVGSSGFIQTYDSGSFSSDSPDIPIPITSNYRYQGANTDLVIVRGHYHKIEYYQFNKNLETDNRLKLVTEASGNIKQTIDYLPMEANGSGLGNPASDFYSSTNSALYPNIEIIRNTGSYLVSRLTATVNGISKFQNFKYHGYVSNFNYGTIGFSKVSRSSWYLLESNPKIWTTQYNDINLRGANTITWTSTNAATVFTATPSDLLSTKRNFFDVYSKGGNQSSTDNVQNNINIIDPVVINQIYKASNTITASSAVNDDLFVNYQAAQVILKDGFSIKPGSNGSFRAFPFAANESAPPATNSSVYNVLLAKQTFEDHITGVKNETVFTYDGTVDSPSYYGLETKKVSKQYSGATLQGITTTDTEYESNVTTTGSGYYVGRPKKINTSITYSGDTRTSEEIYTYTGNELTKTEKKGHNTYAIVEDITYDNVGNLLTKTVSAPAAPTAIAARTITDQYDVTKRFVIKKIDHQNFETNFVYNTLGQVKQSTSYLGVVSDYIYDNWGKLTNTKTTGVSTTPLETTLTYAKLSDGGYTVTSQNTVGDNAKSITQYDVLGREIIKTTKGFAPNSLISKQIVFDDLGRKLKESEPYFSSPTKWTIYEYDYLNRPTTVTASTGRMQTLNYSGLTTTSNDDGKITTATIDALGNKVQTTDPGGTINFTYYANGQLKESDYEGHKVTITIDGWGNKTAMKDPNAGTYTYAYDAFGQITNETTPKGSKTMNYDSFGKLTKKITLGDGADFETDYAYNSFGQLISETSKKSTGAAIDSFTYNFDGFHRLNNTTESNTGFTQTKTMVYDTYGRIANVTNATQELTTGLSNSIITKNNYNVYNGIMDKMTDANDTVLWQLTGANEKMQSLTEVLGNGIAITNAYDSNNYFTSQRHTKNSVDVLYNTYSFNAVKGTLNNRQNVALGTNETFTYDTLDRLTQWTNPLTNTYDSNIYDTKGRITSHNKLGKVNYNTDINTGIYRKKSITLTPEGKDYYTNLPKQTLTYTMFKSPITINESEKGATAFVYNSHLSRQTMNYGYQVVTPGQPGIYTKTKNYTDDGTVEIVKTPTTVTIRTYIGGDAYTAPLYMDRTRTIATGAVVDKRYYLHRDYLGSIIAISDETGTAVERRQFDAWGNLAKLQQNGVAITLPTDGTAAGLMMLDRGYTGHEHLAEVGLIQMNGRLYDPVLRAFLMPDNFIQQPENTQNYNRYAYVLNNPLMYTDPSGEFFIIDDLAVAMIIGAVIGAATYTLTALLADVPFSIGGLAKATFIGAASSAVTFGIGDAAKTIGNIYLRATFQAVSHGTFQGGMTAVSGGKFWSGFAAGALSSIASSAFSWDGNGTANGLGWASSVRDSGAGMIAFGTISGGAGAALTKGNFWQGAATGLVVSGLNHYAHMIKEKQTLDAFAKEKFGDDYKAKYGVKSLKWGSQMKKGEVSGYSYNQNEMLIVGPEGATGGITTSDRRVYISDYFKNTPDMFLEATIGHEFIHSYQRMVFGSKYNSSYSEFSAYQYSINFSLKNNFDSSMTQQYRNYQSSYTKGPKSYNYQNIPGF